MQRRHQRQYLRHIDIGPAKQGVTDRHQPAGIGKTEEPHIDQRQRDRQRPDILEPHPFDVDADQSQHHTAHHAAERSVDERPEHLPCQRRSRHTEHCQLVALHLPILERHDRHHDPKQRLHQHRQHRQHQQLKKFEPGCRHYSFPLSRVIAASSCRSAGWSGPGG